MLSGAIGDRLHDASSSLAVEMRLFHGLQLLALNHKVASVRSLAGEHDVYCLTVPEAGPRACLFIHGLMGSERAWRFGVGESGETVDYGPALARARAQTPLYLRYNTGRHISQNGRELAERLEELRRAWPKPGLEELTIVAHSMGGLVRRSA